MTHNSLIPEAPLLVYPSLAATIGLEEAVFLSMLTHKARSMNGTLRNGFTWFELGAQQVLDALPFWRISDIQRICTNLREQGIILLASAPFSQGHPLKFAFNERAAAAHQTPATAAPQAPYQSPAPAKAVLEHPNPHAHPLHAGAATKKTLAAGWSPDKDTLTHLAQLCVPSEFALQQVPEFVNYWRERGDTAHAWGSKFIKHVIRKWRDYETQEYQRSKTAPMDRAWRPSEDALEVLVQHAKISRSFVEDAIPEFVLYWREQGASSDNWNKKFRDHVQRQWVRYRSALEHDTAPKRIAPNWQPSNEVYEVLRLANIDLPFAQSLIPEFVIYWQDSNQVHSSWNTRFLQYVKQRWAKRDLYQEGAPSAGQPSSANPNKATRDLSLAEQLSDRSWAL